MPTRPASPARRLTLALPVVVAIAALTPAATAQDRLKTMPGYDRFREMSGKAAGASSRGRSRSPGRTAARRSSIARTARPYRYDIADGQGRGGRADRRRPSPAPRRPVAVAAGAALERGRQVASAALARRHAQGVLPRPQPLGRRRQRR